VWRDSVHGLENARRKLQELAKRTTNECFATYSPTRQIVALLNIAEAGQLPAKRVVFQIAYDEHRLVTRAELLRHDGYEVVSAVGNEAAEYCPKLAATLRSLYCRRYGTGTNQKRNG